MQNSWGYTENKEHVPVWLTSTQKKATYANTAGWVHDNPFTGTKEVLVCIKGLDTAIGAGNLMNVDLVTRDSNSSDVTFTVTYNEIVAVNTSGGTPSIDLVANTGTFVGDGKADYVSGTGTNQLTFTYTVVATDNVSSITFPDTLSLNSGTIKDANGTVASVDFTKGTGDSNTSVKPTLTGVTIQKDAINMLTVAVAERAGNDSNVTFTVTFQEAVDVVTTGGTPSIDMVAATGAFTGDGKADYVSGTGTTALVFTYEPVSGDAVTSVTFPDTITLNSGTIKSTDGVNALIDFTTAGVDGATDIKPDTSTMNITVA